MTASKNKPLQQESPPAVHHDDAVGRAGTPLMPHEHDELPGGMTAAEPDPVIQQAKRDLDAGLVDTDMRATPGLDAARRDCLVPTPGKAKADAEAEAKAKTQPPR